MSQSVAAQSSSRSADLIDSLSFTHSADMSADGSYIAWAASRIEATEEIIELWLTNLATGEVVTIGKGSDPVWAPDGSKFVYVGIDNSDTEQYFCYSLVTAKVDKLTSFDQGISGPASWNPKGTCIAFSVPPPRQDRSMPFRITRVVGWQDGLGLVDDATTDIWILDLAAGECYQLTDDDWVNALPIWLAQTGEIAYLATCGPEDWEPLSFVRAVDADGSVRTMAQIPEILAIADVPSSIGQLVLITPGTFQGSFGEVLVLKHDSTIEDRAATLGIDIAGDVIGDIPVPYADPHPRILVSGTSVIVRVQNGDRLEIHRVELEGEVASDIVISTDGCVYPLSLSGNWLLYGDGDLIASPDFWVRDLTTLEARRVSHTAELNSQLLSPTEVEDFWVQHGSGPQVQAKFLRPVGVKGPLPTVLLIHGGPYAGFGQAFVSDAQLLCESGYGVLLVNPRGSRGYGKEFGVAINGDWGNKDYADLMTAVDRAVEEGWADPDRLGVAGLSYGGYMTAWIIAHTHRFKAAVFENGVTNLVSMYGSSDIGLSFLPEVLGATPYEDFDTYIRCSPISNADTATTPTLIIIGSEDHRCPAEQGKQLYSVLKRAGCETEMLVLPGAAHAGSVNGASAVRRAQNVGLLDWMERYV